MRIQHNIMAMNAYRNLGVNNRSLSGNLEKLSSGYKINRAGDDAAGLAISEKMRAQITSLDAAQKNVNDGISLVKTAEGAMQEIQDMLNRMEYLATQSANGTYDNNVDRINLQKEVSALAKEIDRIAEASNFNGTKLLDGSLSANGKLVELTISDVSEGSATSKASFSVTPTLDTNATQDITIGDKYFRIGPSTSETSMAALGGATTGTGTENDPWVITTDSSTTVAEVAKEMAAKITASGEGGTGGTVTIAEKTFTVAADNTGKLTFTATADGEVSGLADTLKEEISIEKVEVNTDKETEESSDVPELSFNTNTGTEGQEAVAPSVTYAGLLNAQPNANATVTVNDVVYTFKSEPTATNDVELGDDLAGTLSNLAGKIDIDDWNAEATEDGIKLVYTGEEKVTEETIAGGVFNAGSAEQTAKAGKSVATITNVDQLTDGDTIKIGATTYEIQIADEAVAEGNTALDFKSEGEVTADKLVEKLAALKPAVDDATVAVAKSGDNGITITITEAEGSEGTLEKAKLEAVELGAQAANGEDKVAANGIAMVAEEDGQTETAPAVNGLRLQIGDTSDEYNQLTVTIGDMHTKAMGTDADKDGTIDAGKSIADVDISTQQGAADAVAVIKDAINYVSSVRGDLGAIQNRLEHTNNNLAVMEENIQDAESTIRDTDIADEMMAYTKNNILIQSAQAMLAQANQVPQGVLQLMQ